MTFAQKAFSSVALIALVTTLVLPGRQTATVLDATRKLLTGTFSTVMGTSSGVK